MYQKAFVHEKTVELLLLVNLGQNAVIQMHLSSSEALQLQIIDRTARRSSRVTLIVQFCSRASVTEANASFRRVWPR